MNIEEERELFDKWYGKKPRGWFEAVRYNTAWRAWLASASREGYKLVPVEASDHMKCVVRDFDPDIEDYANMDKSEWEGLCSDIYKAMIGACDN